MGTRSPAEKRLLVTLRGSLLVIKIGTRWRIMLVPLMYSRDSVSASPGPAAGFKAWPCRGNSLAALFTRFHFTSLYVLMKVGGRVWPMFESTLCRLPSKPWAKYAECGSEDAPGVWFFATLTIMLALTEQVPCAVTEDATDGMQPNLVNLQPKLSVSAGAKYLQVVVPGSQLCSDIWLCYCSWWGHG